EGGTAYLWLPAVLIAALAGVAWLDRRMPEGLALAIGWTGVFGAIVVARQFAGITLAPQPIRYALELDAAAAIAIGIVARWALRVRYIVVTGSASTDAYRDFADPAKFDGRLPVVYDQRGVRIYEVSRVGDPRVVIARVADLAAPTSAIDRAAISEYVTRVASGRAPTALEARGLGGWRAEVDVREGEQVVL